MITAGRLKSTLNEDALGRFHRVPVRMGKKGKKMAPSARAIAGEIATYSPKENPQASCKMSYAHVVETFGVTRATVSESLSDLIDNGVIELSSRDAKGASYRFIATRSGSYIVIPEYLYTATLANGKHLSKAQVLILSYIMTESRKPKNKNVYEGSPARIAWELNYARCTVIKAIKLFLKNSLIYRAGDEKGANGYKLSVYHVNRDLFAYEKYTKKRAKKEQKQFESKDVADANARSERESYYGLLQTKAFNAAETYRKKAFDLAPRLIDIEKEMGRMEIEVAKAELREPDKLPAIKVRQHLLLNERATLLKRFGIDARKFKKEYYVECRACSDTGFRVDGKACDCYLRRRRE